jgi:DNA-binding HxlR family transcriptional regulator
MKIKKPFSCWLGPAFDLVGGRWKAIILWELSQQELRFGELRQRAKGITEKMLLQQLREMEQGGLVERYDYSDKPLRVDYRLTNEGRIVNKLLIPLAEWGKEYAYKIDIAGNYAHAD